MASFFNTVKSEYFKQKRSTVSVLVVLGALFLPTILLAARLVHASRLPTAYRDIEFWSRLWNMAWESVAIVVLPIIVMLVTSLIVQIEYRNNAWKQVHTTPQSLPAVFFAKQLVILAIILGFFVVFNVGIYLVGILPLLLVKGVSYPRAPIPFASFAAQDFYYYLDILPIAALQYLLSLHFRNFMVSLGVGLAQWLVVIGCISWKYLYIFPYAYIALDFEIRNTQRIVSHPPVGMQFLALGYFVVITIISFILYTTKKDRG